ncbi:Citrate synthase [Heracleum sosnowskyi]|uniref:Citrate synthase n=1 Tax=Heracleum sosnowskyi TaxID=360622 RepID=A0AAD8J1Y9_9APIA|nr:Citrate synthase [Heracleum sosnowskyi]
MQMHNALFFPQYSSKQSIRTLMNSRLLDKKNDKGLKLYDPGCINTVPVRSSICYIDGDETIVTYRGYHIEHLAEGSSFVEVAYILTQTEMPTGGSVRPKYPLDMPFPRAYHIDALAEQQEQLYWLINLVTVAVIHVKVSIHLRPESIKLDMPIYVKYWLDTPPLLQVGEVFVGYRSQTVFLVVVFFHGASKLLVTGSLVLQDIIQAMPHDAHPDSYNSKQVTDKEIVCILRKALNIVAGAYLTTTGRPPVLPFDKLSHFENLLYVLDSLGNRSYMPKPHGVYVYIALVGAVGASYCPLYGGANEVVFKMFREIDTINKISKFIEGVKNNKRKMSSFGHRAYKNYDPRAKVIKKLSEEIFSVVGRDTLTESCYCPRWAIALEKAALSDECLSNGNCIHMLISTLA